MPSLESTGLPVRRVLVTGVAGFVGFHLAGRLLTEGVEVLGIDDLNAYYDVALKEARVARLQTHPGFRFQRRDIADHTMLLQDARTFAPDILVHFAAQAGVRHSIDNPWPYAHSNLAGFLSVLECCRALEVGHLLYASSSSVYGANSVVPFREDARADNPVSLYAATKRANEMMAESYAKLYGLPVSGLRFFTLYGPWGRPDMAYWGFTRAILAGDPIRLFNHGDMLRDFTYVDDAIEAIRRLLPLPPKVEGEADACHRIYNIGNASPVTLGDFVSTLERTIGRTAVKELLPMQPGDVPATFADTTRLQEATGYAPATPLAEGLARFVAWYRNFHDR